MDTGDVIIAFLAAAGFGALIGLERQAGKHEQSVVFGTRTFALYGVWGAATMLFADQFGAAAFVVGFGSLAALVVAAYIREAVSSGDRGTTTEAAAFAAFLTGALAWSGLFVVGLAVAVGTAALLRAKEPLHSLAERFSEEDVRAVLQFAVITALVLPLVPNRDFGPFGAFNPREIWLMVVLISAIGLAGYAALRFLGSRGLALTGFLGGLVSSTAVTLGYSRMSRSTAPVSAALAAGILGASAVMYPRVLIEAGVVAPSMVGPLVLPLLAIGLVVLAAAGYWWWRGREEHTDSPKLNLKNPLTLGIALQFGALYALIVFASRALLEAVSASSIQLVGAVSGINDVDAITLSTANLVRDGLDPNLGARVVILAVSVNALVKLAIAASLASRRVRRAVTLGLATAGLAGLVIWVLL